MDAECPLVAALSGEYARNVIRSKARKLSRSSGFRPGEAEDLEQDLLSRMLERIEDYDGRVPLEVYIALLAVWADRGLRRHRRRLKRGGGAKPPFSLDVPLGNRGSGGMSLGAACESSYQPESVHAGRIEKFYRILEGASPLDAAVARALMTGSEFAAAKQLGLSRRQIANAKVRLREQFEKHDLEEI